MQVTVIDSVTMRLGDLININPEGTIQAKVEEICSTYGEEVNGRVVQYTECRCSLLVNMLGGQA